MEKMTAKPCVGITMGDPAGIGPEIVIKSLADPELNERCRPLVVGSVGPMRDALRVLSSDQELRCIETPEEGVFEPGVINLIDLPLDYAYRPGVMQVENGRAAISYMEKAYELLAAHRIDSTASAPCNKEAMKLAGLPFVGATEFYAHLSGAAKAFAVVEQGGCYIFQITSHMSLRKALDSITQEKTEQFLITVYRTLRQWGIEAPRIALSAMNPHAGDGGAMGREEIDILTPAIRNAAAEIGPVDGPVPADSIYIKGIGGVYDGIIFLFHDAANIAVKLMESIHPSVVITGGLPFTRTTVAHGTAYDIAYRGIAGNQQMKNAIIAAAKISARLAEKH